jgi:hypothetical protein
MAELDCRDTDCTHPLPTFFRRECFKSDFKAGVCTLMSDMQRPVDINNAFSSVSCAWMVNVWVSYHKSEQSDVFRLSV